MAMKKTISLKEWKRLLTPFLPSTSGGMMSYGADEGHKIGEGRENIRFEILRRSLS